MSARKTLALLALVLPHLVVTAIPLSRPAYAIDIVIHLDDNTSENPGFDPTGSELKDMFEAAATVWEDLLPQPGVYHVDVEWDDGIGGLGLWTPDPFGNNIIEIHPSPSTPWFVDPTPLDNSEFNTPSQTLFRNLFSFQQVSWFDGNVPDLLEVGFSASAVSGGVADNRNDLFTTVLHELGHELGINFELDDEFDIYSHHVAGQNGVQVEANSLTGHLEPATLLMCNACQNPSRREFPTATDVLTIAHDESFYFVDLARQDYVGSGNWYQINRWIGGKSPDADDDAFLRNGASVTLNDNAHVENLFMSEGAQLDTQNYKLKVDNATNIRTTSELIGNGIVEISGLLANDGTIRPTNGRLTIKPLELDGGAVNLDGGGSPGIGHVDLLQGSLTIDTNNGFTDDFDGTMEIGPAQDVTVNSAWTLGSSGQITMFGQGISGGGIAGGPFIVKGKLRVEGAAEIVAPVQFENSADVEIVGQQLLWLSGPTTFRGGSYTGGGVIGQQNNATVSLPTTISVDTYDMDGANNSPSSITIEEGAPFVLDVRRIEINGDDYKGTMNIRSSTLQVLTHDMLIGFGGQVHRVDRPWRMEGTLNMTKLAKETPTAIPSINGSRMIVGDLLQVREAQAVLNVGGEGESRLNAPVTFEQTALVRIAANTELNMTADEPTIYKGAEFDGPGILRQSADAIVEANTRIDNGVFDMDGKDGASDGNATITINPGVSLHVDTQRMEESGNDFDGTLLLDGGTLNITTHNTMAGPGGVVFDVFSPWRMEGRLELNYDGGAATVTGNKMFVGQPGHIKPLARIVTSPGEAVLDTDVEMEDRAAAEFELGGTASHQFGHLNVTESIIVDGTLAATIVNGFLPAIGDTFEVITAGGSVQNTFSTLDLPALWEWDVHYSANSVILEVLDELLMNSGDHNGDGNVEQGDLDMVLLNWGREVQEDWVDGSVDQDEIDAALLNWGATTRTPPAKHAVPEPATWRMLLFACVAFAARHRYSGCKSGSCVSMPQA